ncbi:vacuolar protein sorting-associated protein vts1 [Diplogelasinospora grovesii]|uniref:Vacuolar protein sorting-associated protein vts1 n=1 Tax=Diplogelasinospora grovesii TaxID=303347 RepID=A0AAN6MYX5_9PEZI|nr:vacuolar protein sorting-associated protein vts1 [Diplogelasinospora grovesii]
MADEIPAALKQADINIWKCATKAAQLQTMKPIIAYWCEYWVVNQILAKHLHSTDEDILRYTTNLMDKLEQTKAKYANEDAIMDDTAGQAYVEQFAQETLDRAERVVKANRVTQQTATTFDAAATFFHLVNIWGQADQETQQKIKYAKWNAARIAKAIKEGRDPNESNPKHEEPPQQPALDPNDPDVQMLGSAPSGSSARPVTIEDVPDADLRRDAAGVSLPHSPASAAPSDGELKLPGVPTEIGRPAAQPGYFDNQSMPSPVSPPVQDPVNFQPSGPELPSAPANWPPPQPSQPTSGMPPPPQHSWQRPSPSVPPPAWSWPQSSQQQQTPFQPAPPPTFTTSPPPTAAVASAPSSYYTSIAPTAHTATGYNPAKQPTGNGNVTVDEAAIALAQKHAKWAISALNFEDVNTAVRELHKALEVLGAR